MRNIWFVLGITFTLLGFYCLYSESQKQTLQIEKKPINSTNKKIEENDTYEYHYYFHMMFTCG